MAAEEKHAASSNEIKEPDFTSRNVSNIRNKKRRQELYKKLKFEQSKAKSKLKKTKKKLIKEQGEDAAPKRVPKTIENQRVPDETMVEGDEEVLADQMTDELAPYFNRQTQPKILITTSDKPCVRTRVFCKQLAATIPNTEFFSRHDQDLKKIILRAKERSYTDCIVINEDRKKPNGMVISHLPDGPTLHFKLSTSKIRTEIRKAGDPTKHLPEVILNNFNTRLGQTVGRVFASLFPHDPQFNGRRVVTFHNQRDFIFFRHHRYQFRNAKKCGLHELGPKFTLKLRSLQKGTFDSKYGEYEWIHKRHEMDTSRRKFNL
ncbi:ribosome production factor 1-like [Watersipora subatra]|uniref:ribosome production factor 1-like n=1 Tax=Watersipora subatra TaxID=2589382 RepID=UPI00355B8C30